MECVFCNIVKGKIPAKIIAQNKNAIAFLDINPVSNGHTVIITKQHFQDWSRVPEDVFQDVLLLSKQVVEKLDHSVYRPWGYNYLSNQGDLAGQTVFHFHLHVIPKYSKEEGYQLHHGKIVVDPIETVYERLMKK